MAKIALAPGSQDSSEAMTEYVCPTTPFKIYSFGLFIHRDDRYYLIQSERSQIFSEKQTLEKVYAVLLEEHRALQTAHDDALAEKEEARSQLRQLQREAGSRRTEKPDAIVRVEMDRLRGELYVAFLQTFVTQH